MKALILLLVVVLVVGCATTVTEKDVELREDGKIYRKGSSVLYAGIIMVHKNVKKYVSLRTTGHGWDLKHKAEIYYPDGKIRARGNRHEFEAWYPSGGKKAEITGRNALDGNIKMWNENGNKIFEVSVVGGKPRGFTGSNRDALSFLNQVEGLKKEFGDDLGRRSEEFFNLDPEAAAAARAASETKYHAEMMEKGLSGIAKESGISQKELLKAYREERLSGPLSKVIRDLLAAEVKAAAEKVRRAAYAEAAIEAAIRKELKKPTGELTKADLEKVTELWLDDNQLTDLKGLEKLTQLTYLNLNFNKLTNVKGLEKLTRLKTLNLHDNKLTDVKGLENLTQLKYLHLYGNQLTSVKGLENLTQLTKLNLKDNTALTEVQIDQLQKALPNCKIYSNPTK